MSTQTADFNPFNVYGPSHPAKGKRSSQHYNSTHKPATTPSESVGVGNPLEIQVQSFMRKMERKIEKATSEMQDRLKVVEERLEAVDNNDTISNMITDLDAVVKNQKTYDTLFQKHKTSTKEVRDEIDKLKDTAEDGLTAIESLKFDVKILKTRVEERVFMIQEKPQEDVDLMCALRAMMEENASLKKRIRELEASGYSSNRNNVAEDSDDSSFSESSSSDSDHSDGIYDLDDADVQVRANPEQEHKERFASWLSQREMLGTTTLYSEFLNEVRGQLSRQEISVSGLVGGLKKIQDWFGKESFAVLPPVKGKKRMIRIANMEVPESEDDIQNLKIKKRKTK